MGDMIQSGGVIIASCILLAKPEWKVVDPICTFMFSILVLCTTVPIFKECYNIVFEGSPPDVDTIQLYNDILALPSV